jgi:AcrR family transcriptional regulator
MNDFNASRVALVQAGLRNFGDYGFEGASVRRIAQAAKTPISAITYHFQTKHGLYLACAKHIADTIGGLMSPALHATKIDADAPDAKAQARAALVALMTALTRSMVVEEVDSLSMFIMREQAEPTEAFAIIYGGVMGGVVSRIAELLTIISGGRLTPIAAQVRAIATMGQVMGFRVARAAVLRATGWTDVGAEQVDQIQAIIADHTLAIAHHIERETGI